MPCRTPPFLVCTLSLRFLHPVPCAARTKTLACAGRAEPPHLRPAAAWDRSFLFCCFWRCLWQRPPMRASFDCAKATGKVEKMICADSVLSKLDEKMASMHRKASDATADPVGFRQEHGRWLKKRNTCAEGGCVAQTYQERLAALRSLLRGPKPCFRLLERKWPEVKSGHYPVCVDVLKSMNALCAELPFHGGWKVSPSVSSLAVPQWEELDPRNHLHLIQHRYQPYQTEKAPEEQWAPIPPDPLQNINEGKASLWHTKVDVDRDGQQEDIIRFRPYPCEGETFACCGALQVADASLYRVDLRYSLMCLGPVTDIILHHGYPFIIKHNLNNTFSVEEPFSTQAGDKGSRSVCVFEWLKP